MKKFFLLFIISSSLFASIFDEYNLYKAQTTFKKSDLNASLEYYKKIENKTDKMYYNMANIYYKQKNYKEAINSYNKIKDETLQYKTLHNLGNTYAHEEKIEKAIEAYEKALEIKDDNDTRFNLELLKQKQQNEQNQKNKDEQNKKNDKSQDKEDKNEEEKDSNENEKNMKENEQKQQEHQKDNQSKEKQERKKEIEEEQEKLEEFQNDALKKDELSNIEDKKWAKMLEKRGINTLMTPIKTKGEKNENHINPW